MGLKSGKIGEKLLERLLSNLWMRGEVVEGPAFGVDAALIDICERFLVVTSDPITFVGEDAGYYLVHINANDVAVMGGEPAYLLVDILLEEGCEESLPVRVMDEISKIASQLGISVIGGHTEVTPGLDRTIVIGTMIGFTEGRRYFHPRFVKVGDRLILTKGIAIEGTSIIVRERKEESIEVLKGKFERAYNFIKSPGLSVLKESRIAGKVEGVHAMHDPTEGGLAQGVRELLHFNGLGAHIYYDEIKVYEETEKLCRFFGLDPLGLIASGALLIAVDERSTDELIRVFERENVESRVIGVVKEGEYGIMLEKEGKIIPLPYFERDEITKIL